MVKADRAEAGENQPGAARLSALARLRARLFQPVDNASIIFFRVAFGSLLLVEAFRYFQRNWIFSYWIEPKFFFSYYGFSWLRPLPGDGMYTLWLVLGICGACIALGLVYRLAAAIFFLGFTYSFLLGQA